MKVEVFAEKLEKMAKHLLEHYEERKIFIDDIKILANDDCNSIAIELYFQVSFMHQDNNKVRYHFSNNDNIVEVML